MLRNVTTWIFDASYKNTLSSSGIWCWIVLQPLCWVQLSLAKYSKTWHGFEFCVAHDKELLKSQIYLPYMQWNNVAFLFWAKIIFDSCYVVTASDSNRTFLYMQFPCQFSSSVNEDQKLESYRKGNKLVCGHFD